MSRRAKAKVKNQKVLKKEKDQKGPQALPDSKREVKRQRDQVTRKRSMDHAVMEPESKLESESRGPRGSGSERQTWKRKGIVSGLR